MVNVAKYGGTSLANKAQMDKVYPLLGDINVFSAPGSDPNNPIKLTELLIGYANSKNYEIGKKIIQIFSELEKSLDVDISIASRLKDDLEMNFPSDNHRYAYLASRGERYNVELLYHYFKNKGANVELILPEEYGILMEGSLINASYSKKPFKKLDELLSLVKEGKKLLTPGFYSVNDKGEVAILSRGGGDTSGGYFSNLFNAEKYTIWSDRDGIYEADPRIIPHSKVISLLIYDEAQILGSFGSTIIHPDAISFCQEKNIPIFIKNTNNPIFKGTKIVRERLPNEAVIGISIQSSLAYIQLYKSSAINEIGFTAKALDVLTDNSINTHYYPTIGNHLDLFVEQNDFLRAGVDNVINEIDKQILPNKIKALNDISLLTLVGIGMKTTPGILGKAATVLGDNGINILVTSQSSGSPSICLGVNKSDANRGLELLYDKFFKN
jgi:aspartate kinase